MSILILILQLIPALLETIVTIEKTAPIAKVGAQKSALVSQMVTSLMGATSMGKHSIPQDQLLSIIQAITVSIVSFYNLIGVFKQSPAASVATTTPAVPAGN